MLQFVIWYNILKCSWDLSENKGYCSRQEKQRLSYFRSLRKIVYEKYKE